MPDEAASHARAAAVKMDARSAYRAVGLAGALVLGALIAQQLTTLILIIVLTIIVSLPLSSAATHAEQRGLPRTLGAAGALIVALAALGALGFALIPGFVSDAKQFAAQLPATVASAERGLHGFVGLKVQSLSVQLSDFVRGYSSHPQRLIGPAEQIGLGAAGAILVIVLVLLGALLIAIRPDPLTAGVLRLLPASWREPANEVMARVKTAWGGWLTAIALDISCSAACCSGAWR